MNNHDEVVTLAQSFLNSFLSRAIHVLDAPWYPSKATLERMGDVVEQIANDPDTFDFDVLVRLAAALMRKNERLPGWLALFAAKEYRKRSEYDDPCVAVGPDVLSESAR